MAKLKTFTIDVTKLKDTNTYNLKDVGTLKIGTNHETVAYESVTAKGSTVILEMYTDNHNDFVTITLKNCDRLKNLYYATSYMNQEKRFDTEHNYIDEVIGMIPDYTSTDTDDSNVVTGSIWGDTIDMSGNTAGYTINALAGNDEITGSDGDDTITGGTGENTIYITEGDDRIKLTKNEDLIIDASALGLITSADEKIFAKNVNGDLVLRFDNAESKDSIILDKFVKSNIVGANGSVKLYLGTYNDGDDDIPVTFDLNKKALLSIISSDAVYDKKKNTATVTGTRLGDDIDISGKLIKDKQGNLVADAKIIINAGEGDNYIDLADAENANTITAGSGNDKVFLENTGDYQNAKRVTTVKAGNGANEITVSGKGNNVVVTGSGNDTFTFKGVENTNLHKTTIKAGAGENTIKIKDDIENFGEITIAEENVRAKNNVVINNIGDYSLEKTGNDLTIKNDINAFVKVNGYFAGGKKSATTTFNGDTLDEIIAENNLVVTVYGTKTVKGSAYADDIQTMDSLEYYTSKGINDKIYAGKGDDTINAGKGKNSIYMYAGDGADTIVKGGGNDTLIFKKGTAINIGFVASGNSDEEGNALYDVRIYYNKKDASDFALIKDAATAEGETYKFNKDATSVRTLKVGSKSYKLESLVNRNKIENVVKNNNVVGTAKHDDIYVNDPEKFNNNTAITINGAAGCDVIMIGSNSESEQGNADGYNIDPDEYNTLDIEPTVYTHTTDGKQDTSVGTYDKVVSYATNGGEYFAQSAISDIKVYGWDNNGNGTDDTYHTFYNNQFTKLYDEAGNDTLYIADKTSDELKLVFTVSKDYKDFTTEFAKVDSITDDNKAAVANLIGNSLQEVKLITSEDREYFLLNPDENNDIGIDIDYWGDKGIEGADDESAEALLALGKDKLAKFGGGIERIYASDGKYITSDDIAQVASNVASWLNGNGHAYGTFDSVEAVLETGGDAWNALLAKFDTLEWREPDPVQ